MHRRRKNIEIGAEPKTLEEALDLIEIYREALGINRAAEQTKIHLPKVQKALLGALYTASGLLSHEAIEQALWGTSLEPPEYMRRTLTVHMFKLRKIVEPLGIEIKLSWNEGYYMDRRSKELCDRLIWQDGANALDNGAEG